MSDVPPSGATLSITLDFGSIAKIHFTLEESMKISLSNQSATEANVDLVVVPLTGDKKAIDASLKTYASAFGANTLAQLLDDEGFEGKPNQTAKVATRGKIAARWLLFVGLDPNQIAEIQARTLGRLAAKSASKQKKIAIALSEVNTLTVRAVVEGLTEGAYEYREYKTKSTPSSLASVALLVGAASNESTLSNAVRNGIAVAESVNTARDLVNAPPNDLHPVSLARFAQQEAKKLGLTCKIWDKKKIESEKMDLFLAVNRGSAIEPRLIHVVHKPRNAKKKIVFVGKGLTFDSGGLCIKPAGSMIDMKCDMAGAATTLAIVFAAARLNLPIEVHGIVGSTENMTGSAAYRPGDVYKSHEGKTVEIINTDAEGRNVLADVLSWATSLKPDVMIDHATLTGACMVALGPYRAGLFTDDDQLAADYLDAAASEGESFWRLPLDSDLRPMLKSDIADLKHTGSRWGGSITAALFLKEFVGNTTWMHLDIAGPAYLEGPHARHPKGGTGFGVATGVRFLESLANDKASQTAVPKSGAKRSNANAKTKQSAKAKSRKRSK
ncbi:MAG: leucyl aminopeptidase [Polyangiales bacterium]